MIDLKHCVRAIYISKQWRSKLSDFLSAASTASAAQSALFNASAAYPSFDSTKAERTGEEDYSRWRSATMAEMCRRNAALWRVNIRAGVSLLLRRKVRTQARAMRASKGMEKAMMVMGRPSNRTRRFCYVETVFE
ncbi:hypothetical protein A4X13_0g7221 [Tilletia indica]|uniref:Uncharacterized protein n=1 Tax=Tilletia indica TaxID=43049 RepID=A0A8T8SK44_9BASI|nr:hypothetical protein A4X13_0g7221 [Tilletia indica]